MEQNERQVLEFNTDWLYIEGDDRGAVEQDYDESQAKAVSLPHARENYDLYDPDIDRLQTVDWYRRHFTLSKADEGDRVIVEFNGGGQVNRVYVNGALVGEAKGTFTHFSFDITDYVTFGDYDNIISVQVDSRYHSGEMPPGQSIDFHFFGGLHGRASLTLVDPLRASSVFYYNEDVVEGCENAVLRGQIDVKNDYEQMQAAKIVSIIKDADGTEVDREEIDAEAAAQDTTQVQLSHTIAQPHLWSPDDPYLYTAETQVWVGETQVDAVDTTIGIRTFSATSPSAAEGYFSLNGERIEVLGGNRHMQAPYLGNSLTEKLNQKDAETLKNDLGINFVRTSHYESDPSFLEACDRLGIMVEEEPLGWQDTPGWDQFCYSYDEMVKRDRNHASIVMWSIIPNERGTNFPSIAEGQNRQAVSKRLDPSRLTIQEEMNQSEVIADVYGWHDYQMPPNLSVPSKARSWFITEWNTNLGKHFVVPNDSETRKIAQVEKDGYKMASLSGDQRIMGTLKWDLFGYMTPMSEDERGKNVDIWRCSGVYGHWRDPLHKTWIANLMAAQTPGKTNIGDILFINSEWKQDSPHSLTVTSNLDEVELYYSTGDGVEELIQRLTAPNELTNLKKGLFRFQTGSREWTEDSYLLAKGYRRGETSPVKEHKVFASTYTSEKEGATLTLHNTIGDIKADGSDVAYLLAELKDKNGQREFYGDENVTAEIVSGPGELVYSGTSPVMADGLSGFYLRSKQDQTGSTTVKVSADLGETFNDDDASIVYRGNWQTITGRQDAWKGDYHQGTAGATATITFTGTQLAIYSESQNGSGTATVLVDEQPAEGLTCANADKYGTIGNYRVWKSDVLEYGEHTVKITAQGRINIDRLKVFDGTADVEDSIDINTVADTAQRVVSAPELPDAECPDQNALPELQYLMADYAALNRFGYESISLARLDESAQLAQQIMDMENPSNALLNEAAKQLRNAMNTLKVPGMREISHTRTTMEGQTGGVYYYSKNQGVWVAEAVSTYANKSRSANDFYSIAFEGVKIALYTKTDTNHGMAAVSIDGGTEEMIDLYSAQNVNDRMFWESPVLSEGHHTVKVRVTAQPTSNPNNACVSFKRAVVYTGFDPLQQAQSALAESIAEANTVNRAEISMESLEELDLALIDAERILQDQNAEVQTVEDAKEALNTVLGTLTEGDSSGVTPDAKELQEAVNQLNDTTLKELSKEIGAAFEWRMLQLISKSRNVMTGCWPNIELAEQLPGGTTVVRLSWLKEEIAGLIQEIKEAEPEEPETEPETETEAETEAPEPGYTETEKPNPEGQKPVPQPKPTPQPAPQPERKPIKVNAASIAMQKGKTTTALKVSDVASDDKVVSWKSSNSKIVKVVKKGKIKAVGIGKATITITTAKGQTAVVKVNVQKKPVKTKKISGLSRKVTLKKGRKLKLNPVLTPITSTDKLTYKTANKKIAAVTGKGIITGKKAGTTKITVKSGKKSYTVTVKVVK